MSVKIGPYELKSRFLLAPMAGITDRPHRELCHHYGAGLTVSEMISSDLSLMHTTKSKQRMIQRDEPVPRSVQIVGTVPEVMAHAAQFNVEKGANIIDINMGCPAKKVCNTFAGSALMKKPDLVKGILTEVVSAVDVPVTLKIRTGWNTNQRNGLMIAKIAEEAGISCLAIHGRTRNQAYTGHAEYETIRLIKQQADIPIIANGDIHTIEDASFIFNYTGVDGLMLGRITQGQPWIIKELDRALLDSNEIFTVSLSEKKKVVLKHIHAIHRHYGTDQGVRIARKHIGWYLYNLVGQDKELLKKLKVKLFSITEACTQYTVLKEVLEGLH